MLAERIGDYGIAGSVVIVTVEVVLDLAGVATSPVSVGSSASASLASGF